MVKTLCCMAKIGKRDRDNQILSYLGAKIPTMHSVHYTWEEKALFNQLNRGAEHSKIYNYHLDLTLDFIKMLFSRKTDTATICKHTVLKADVGRVKFCLMAYLENKELSGISFRMHSVASNTMPNSGLNNEGI